MREVLLEMDKNAMHRELQESSTTAMLDVEVAEKLLSGSKGLLAKVPFYITDRLTDVMDMFLVGSTATRNYYKHRLDVKSVLQGLAHFLKLYNGAWEDELLELIGIVCYNASGKLSIGNDNHSKMICKELGAFGLTLLTARTIRILPTTIELPASAVGLLDSCREKGLIAPMWLGEVANQFGCFSMWW